MRPTIRPPAAAFMVLLAFGAILAGGAGLGNVTATATATATDLVVGSPAAINDAVLAG